MTFVPYYICGGVVFFLDWPPYWLLLGKKYESHLKFQMTFVPCFVCFQIDRHSGYYTLLFLPTQIDKGLGNMSAGSHQDVCHQDVCQIIL